MKKQIFIILFMYVSSNLFCQDKSNYDLSFAVNSDYSYSGLSNTILAGPALIWSKRYDHESGFVHSVNIQSGLTWSKKYKSSFTTSAGYFFGYMPGLVFGLSSQQYFNHQNKYGNSITDVRLSGEVFFALFGVIGYRYQHPLSLKNESVEISRHAIVIRLPIPIKSL